jgi:hypothetical protein
MARGLALAAIAITSIALSAQAGRATPSETLAQAERIRAEVGAKYRGLAVTEASTTGVVHSLTLLGGPAPRVVPAVNGVYYAICPVRARCPYPGRRGFRLRAVLPRRIAFELAVRTFRETAAHVVVVALPTKVPVLFVAERGAALPDKPLDSLWLSHLYSPQSLTVVTGTTETLVLARR